MKMWLYPPKLVLYVQEEWGERRSFVSPLFSGYGHVVYGIGYVWGSIGYAQIGARSPLVGWGGWGGMILFWLGR